MHPEIFRAFDEICLAEKAGGAVLEIGATPGADTLLRLPSLAGATSRTGIDLEGGFADETLRIVQGNANRMDGFADASFDTVLCNSMLEHDPRFWLTLAEVRRVAKPRALVAIGVPTYGEMGDMPLRSWSSLLKRLPGGAATATTLRVSAATLGRHDFPGDYYRFSRTAVEEIFLEGCAPRSSRVLLDPPRVVGWGRRGAG
jgi:SAM-dependent methyltransferase